MKPLSEFREELLKFAGECDRKETDYWHDFANGLRNSASLLQAWSRETDDELLRDTEPELDSSWIMWVRDKILGTYPSTTRTEGKK